jgi:hypothetical protein
VIALTKSQCEGFALDSVGLSQVQFSVNSPEFFAILVRQAAASISPCTRRELTEHVLKHLSPLAPERPWRDEIRETIESLLALGDLVEVCDEGQETNETAVYLAPNSFVELTAGLIVLLGGYQNVKRLIPTSIDAELSHVWYTRRLHVTNADVVRETLLDFGFLKLRPEFWLRSPDGLTAPEQARRYDEALSRLELRPALIEEVLILDTNVDVKRYSRRWSPLQGQTGRFVGRRPQAFGSRLWCYMEVANGMVVRHIDLPHFEQHSSAFDEAWHLQLGLDSLNGTPQLFSVRAGAQSGERVIDIYSLLPSWALRRWNSLGLPVQDKAAWFSFAIQEKYVQTEIDFATERLWLKQV